MMTTITQIAILQAENERLRSQNSLLRKKYRMSRELIIRMCVRDDESRTRRKEVVRLSMVKKTENCRNCKHRDCLATHPNCEKCINGGNGWVKRGK